MKREAQCECSDVDQLVRWTSLEVSCCPSFAPPMLESQRTGGAAGTAGISWLVSTRPSVARRGQAATLWRVGAAVICALRGMARFFTPFQDVPRCPRPQRWKGLSMPSSEHLVVRGGRGGNAHARRSKGATTTPPLACPPALFPPSLHRCPAPGPRLA